MNSPPAGPPEPSSVELVLHPGHEMRAYVDGGDGPTPMLVIATLGVDVMVSPQGSTVTEVDVAAAELLAAATAQYWDRLRDLMASRERHEDAAHVHP